MRRRLAQGSSPIRKPLAECAGSIWKGEWKFRSSEAPQQSSQGAAEAESLHSQRRVDVRPCCCCCCCPSPLRDAGEKESERRLHGPKRATDVRSSHNAGSPDLTLFHHLHLRLTHSRSLYRLTKASRTLPLRPDRTLCCGFLRLRSAYRQPESAGHADIKASALDRLFRTLTLPPTHPPHNHQYGQLRLFECEWTLLRTAAIRIYDLGN